MPAAPGYCCSCVSCVPGASFAQQSSAINGAVTDESGGAVPNAQVTLPVTGQGAVFKVVTNAAGEYSVPALDGWKPTTCK